MPCAVQQREKPVIQDGCYSQIMIRMWRTCLLVFQKWFSCIVGQKASYSPIGWHWLIWWSPILLDVMKRWHNAHLENSTQNSWAFKPIARLESSAFNCIMSVSGLLRKFEKTSFKPSFLVLLKWGAKLRSGVIIVGLPARSTTTFKFEVIQIERMTPAAKKCLTRIMCVRSSTD